MFVGTSGGKKIVSLHTDVNVAMPPADIIYLSTTAGFTMSNIGNEFRDGIGTKTIIIRSSGITLAMSGAHPTMRAIPLVSGDTLVYAGSNAGWRQIAGNVGMGLDVIFPVPVAVANYLPKTRKTPYNMSLIASGVRKGASAALLCPFMKTISAQDGILYLSGTGQGTLTNQMCTTVAVSPTKSRASCLMVVPLDDDCTFDGHYSQDVDGSSCVVIGYKI